MDGYAVLESPKSFALSKRMLSGVGAAYLIVLFIAGFLTNFLPTGAINTGTVLLYLLASLLSLIGIIYLVNPLRKHIAVPAFLVLILSVLCIVKATLDVNPMSDRVRELIILFLGAWPFFFFLQMRDPGVRQGFSKIIALGLLCLSIFGIFQGIFVSYLPLSLFVLRGDEPFALYGVDSLRPTGLTGNPIIFSSILVFASAYFAALWFEERRFKYLLALICSLAANYLTYTRASIVLVIPVLIAVWLFHNRFRIKHKVAVLAILLLAIAGGQYLLLNGANLMIIQRLTNSNPESNVSTLEHFVQIQNAKDAIVSHPWIGMGVGSQGDFVGPGEAIITDGAWWALFLEFGGPLSILILLSLCIVLRSLWKYVLWRESKNRAIAIATLSFHAYLIPGNFIDSGILGHISFGLYWAVLGLSLAGMDNDSTVVRLSKEM